MRSGQDDSVFLVDDDSRAVLTLGQLARLAGAREPVDPALARMQFPRFRARAETALWRQGDRFQFLYALLDGAFKTIAVDAYGTEQVLAFPLAGEVVGLEGVGGVCTSTTVALRPGWVVRLAFAELAALAVSHGSVRRLLNLLFGEEIERRNAAIRLLGLARSEARLAAFLLERARRANGRVVAPGSTVELPMTRADIGSFLGLRLETVSRGFSALASAGMIRAAAHSVALLEPRLLQSAVETRKPPL